jgi:multidrug resistance protein, MATE family
MSRDRAIAEIRRLAGPASLSALLFALMEVVDTFMLGAIGAGSVAGVAIGSTILCVALAFPLGHLRVVTPLAACETGTSGLGRTRALLRITLAASLAYGLAVAGLLAATAAALPRLGYDPDLVSSARSFLLVRAPLVPVELALFGLWMLLEGLGDTVTPLVAGASFTLANLGFNFLLIPGRLVPWSRGATGAALATNLALLVGTAILSLGVRARLRRAERRPARPAFRPSLAARFVRLGLPLAGVGLFDVFGVLLLGLLVAREGTAVTATHGLLAQVITLGLATASGLAVAAVTLVARARGGGDRRREGEVAARSLRLQLLLGAASSIALVSTGPLWIPSVAAGPGIADGSIGLLPLAAAILFFEGLALVLGGVVEGAGRTRLLLEVTLLCDLGVALPLFLLLPRGEGLRGLYLIWLAKDLLRLGLLGLGLALSPARIARILERSGALVRLAPLRVAPVDAPSPRPLPSRDPSAVGPRGAPPRKRSKLLGRGHALAWCHIPLPDT